MKSLHKLLFLLLTVFAVSTGIAQSNFINYQGLVNDDTGAPLASQSVTIDLEVRFGMATSTPVYEETHTVTTDTNGVFSLQIGDGTPSVGDYNTLVWGMDDAFVTTSINGTEVGTTEFNAVPFALNTLGGGDSFWNADGNNIYNNNTDNVGVGTSTPGAKFMVKGTGTNPTFNVVTSTGTIPSLIVNDNGRVGVGTDMPGARLMVVGETGAPTLNIVSPGDDATSPSIRVNDDRNVGVGTSTPGAKFMVKGTGTNPTLNVVTSTGTIPSLRVNDNGRVGVGTDMPGARLMVVGESGAPTLNIVSPGDDATSPSIRVNDDRNVGVGTSTPGAKFMVKGTGTNPTLNVVTSTGTIPSLRVNDNGRVGVGTDMPGARLMVVGESGAPALNILPQSGATPALRVNDNGRVGIGTTMPNEELEVNGDVMADSFIAPGMTYADYVFEAYYNETSEINPAYTFKSLSEVESFIKKNGHIEGYKSINEIPRNAEGYFLINVNEQANTNQEKIEELYLHIIEQEKKIKKMEALLEKLLNEKE